MGRCTSLLTVPNVRGRKDDKGKVIQVLVRCEAGTEGHVGAHWNGHEGAGDKHTREWT